MKAIMLALAMCFVSGSVWAAEAPKAAPPATAEARCTPDGKECKDGKDCKAENCKPPAPAPEAPRK